MSEIAVSSNTVIWNIPKGTSAQISINKSNGWAMYDLIRMDFKNLKEINSPVIFSLTIGNGLTIDGNRLIISLTYQQTSLFVNPIIHADVKLRIGTEVIEPIPFLINITETVTKLP
jgi:hypothetical protein